MSDDGPVGGDILRLVTTGMYDNPLVIYREYLQNAADSLASLDDRTGSVSVTIDPVGSQITILDNGAGLSPTDAIRHLVHIGKSVKVSGVDRGLRGIGRLSALAFAENVHFTTRTHASESVTRVSWSGRALRELDAAHIDAKTVVEACTTVQSLPDDHWPDRFFQVTIDRVTRHAASTILNRDVVRSYIGEVCPVPLAPSFPLADEIRNFLADHTDYLTLDVRFNGDSTPIMRPFGGAIPLTDDYSAVFERLETRMIPQPDQDRPAAVLWLAHTSYAGSISRRLAIRGLRARAGNIQIGSDDIFDHLFHETRFNGWCVGEVHIVDSRIVPNGRRDYFEFSPHLRNLENHIGAVAQEISANCRRASSQRNKLRAVSTAINQVKCARDLAASGYLCAEDIAELLERHRKHLSQIRETLQQAQVSTLRSDLDELDLCESQLDAVEPDGETSSPGVPTHSTRTLQSAFGVLARVMPPDTALNTIETILRRLSSELVPPIPSAGSESAAQDGESSAYP